MSTSPIECGPVLAAEDEESDAALLQLAFARANSPKKLVIVRDGQQVLDYLNGIREFSDRGIYPLPSVLLLDLKLPHLGGFEVLQWIRERPQFADLKIFIFSSSTPDSNIERALRMGAAALLIKPHGMQELIKVVKTLTSDEPYSIEARNGGAGSPAALNKLHPAG
jgi:CheY-like chemotaxis protein